MSSGWAKFLFSLFPFLRIVISPILLGVAARADGKQVSEYHHAEWHYSWRAQ